MKRTASRSRVRSRLICARSLTMGWRSKSQQQVLSPKASARYSAVGNIAWGAQTMIFGLTYFISILSRGQSQPLAVHFLEVSDVR